MDGRLPMRLGPGHGMQTVSVDLTKWEALSRMPAGSRTPRRAECWVSFRDSVTPRHFKHWQLNSCSCVSITSALIQCIIPPTQSKTTELTAADSKALCKWCMGQHLSFLYVCSYLIFLFNLQSSSCCLHTVSITTASQQTWSQIRMCNVLRSVYLQAPDIKRRTCMNINLKVGVVKA